jgi:TPR repeat protein
LPRSPSTKSFEERASETASQHAGDYGEQRDYDEALKWYTLAAKQGNAAGQAGLDRLTGGLNADRAR